MRGGRQEDLLRQPNGTLDVLDVAPTSPATPHIFVTFAGDISTVCIVNS